MAEIFGLNFYSGHEVDFYDELIAASSSSFNKIKVATPNSDFIYRSERDCKFKEILLGMDYLIADGMPIVLVQKIKSIFFHKVESVSRITGASLTHDISLAAVNKGLRIAFVGGEQGVAEKARDIILNQTGCTEDLILSSCPPFGFEVDREYSLKLAQTISDFRPHFLFLAVGSPKQEQWIFDYDKFLKYGCFVGVGASLDFIAKTKKRAPLIIQKIGLEWLFRVVQEPKRLAARYLRLMLPFSVIFLREIFRGVKK